MNRTGSRFPIALGLLVSSLGVSLGQDVKTTRLRTVSGERVVRVEETLRESPGAVWLAFSTEKGLRCWIAPVVRLDLRTGGSLSTNYDKTAAIGSPGTISLVILNYVENEEITFRVKLN